MSTRPRRVKPTPPLEPVPPPTSAPSRASRGRGRGRGAAASAATASRGVSGRPRRHAVVKSYAEVEVDDDGDERMDDDEKAAPSASSSSPPDLDDSDPLDEDDESEYERTHRLVMEPEMLPSGRPAVHHILAHRNTPPHWRTQSGATSSASSASGDGGGVDSEWEDALRGRVLAEMDGVARVLVESSELLMEVLSHQFFCTFKHMSFLHTAWLPLSALMEEGVKMKIKLSKYLRGDNLLLDGDNDEDEVREELIDTDFTCVDKILAVREGRRRDDIAGVRRFWPVDTPSNAASSTTQLSLHHHHSHQPVPSSSQAEQRNNREYLCKWSSLPYSASTWERPCDFRDSLKVEQFENNTALPTAARLQSRRLHPTRPPASAWKKLEEGVEYKGGNQLRPWQVEGVSWLLFNWYHRKGSILADEMGLGKTVQIVASLQHIYNVYAEGPFLVIVPLSTIQHWKREFELWTDLNVVLLQGSKHDRDMIVEYEWSYRDGNGEEKWKDVAYKFHVCIATYESVLAETALLAKIKFRAVCIDEAHRLKNKDSKLFKALAQISAEHRILLTGTPIQNNMEELWTLLHYIEPKNFPSLTLFIADYGLLQKTEQVTALQQRLAPYLLRRMKEDVAKKLPKKEETIVEVELTLLQKQYYRAVLERNRQWLNRGVKTGNVPKLLNVVMQLRKVCSHPFLIEGAEEKEYEEIRQRLEEKKVDPQVEAKAYEAEVQREQLKVLIGSSGKLTLCDKLLPRLQAEGHRVLIFSQMKLVLNLLEQYLELKGYEYERIDGNIRGNDRQAAIDRFCKEGSSVFVFLLSTRAGGLGINLATADTVIIFDSDWNPQNDMQAQARAHRIGQKQEVKVYRLITSRTYEMEMFRRASLKLGLDQAVLRKMQVNEGRSVQYGQVDSSLSRLSQMDKKEVESLLKYGAYDLFNEAADAASQSFCEEDIDQILSKRTTVVQQRQVDDDEGDDDDGAEVADDGGAENGDEAAVERRQLKRKRDAGSTFSKANFTSSTSDSAVDLHATDFWERVIPDQKSALKMQRRLESAAVFADEASRQSFLADLFELVQEVIGLRQQGVEAANLADVLDVLMKMTEMGGEGQFTDDERLQASEWMLEIEKPKRQRRTMERWADITSPAALAEVNGLDVSDLRASGDWSRAGEGAKRRKLKASGRQYTRRERKAMIGAVTTLAGLCPIAQPALRSALQPPIPDVWQAIHAMSGLTDRPFDEFSAFSLAFLAYCAAHTVGDEEDSAVFRLARQRLIAHLPPPVLAVKEESKEATAEAEANEEMKDVSGAVEEDAGAEGKEARDPMTSPFLSTPSTSPAPAVDGSSSPAPLSPIRDLLPPTAVRSQTTTTVTTSSSAPPPPPVTVRASSTALTGSERQSRQGRSAGSSSRALPSSIPSSSLDPRTASFNDFPSMAADKQFHKHVMKRVKKWARYMAIQQLVQRELELHVTDRDRAATLKVDSLVEVTADSDLDDSSDDDGDDIDSIESSDSDDDTAGASTNPAKTAMTVRSRGRKWKRESMREQQRRVKEEGRKRKAAEERLKGDQSLLLRLQQRFGVFYDLSIPTKVDRSPAWWWTAADDKALMVGVSRHGTNFYDVETDAFLGFTRRLCDEPPAANDADYDPFVDGIQPPTSADGEALPATTPALTVNGSSGGSTASLSCICNQPRYGRATKGTTKVCGRCHHFFHLDCLEKAREDNSLRAELFPLMPPDGFQRAQPQNGAEAKDGDDVLVKKEGEERSAETTTADERMDDEETQEAAAVKMEVDEDGSRPGRSKRAGGGAQEGPVRKARGTLAEPLKTRGRGSKGAVNASVDLTEADGAEVPSGAALDSPAVKTTDAKGDEDDEDEDDRPTESNARSFANAGWLCDRCEMTFPTDRALELRLRSLLEAFDRDRQSLLRLADRSERAKVEKKEKRKKAEEVSSVWTKKERTRFQRAIQMYGSSDTALGMMRRKMGLKNKSEAVLRQHCDRYIAQCKLLVAAARREQDIAIYVSSKKELKVRGEELRLLQLRVERLVEREKVVERQKEDRRKKGTAVADDSEEEDLSAYCFCEGKVDDQFMVCCDALLPGCKEWYHGQCVGITQTSLPSTWFCPHCTREKAKETTGEMRAELQPAISLQVHPPSPVSAHVLSHTLTASTPQPPSSAHSSAPTSASAHSAFSFAPPAPPAPGFDPSMASHAYVAQSYPAYQQPQQQDTLHYHYQQQQQMGMQSQAPMYGHPGGYGLVGMSPANAPPGMYNTYMFPQSYSHPLQQMGSQPAMYLSNGQQVMMQSMQPVDMMGYYYSQPYGQPHPQLMYSAQYPPMGVHVSQPQSIVHSQPQSAFSAPPPAPVVPLSAQPPPVQPLQPPAAPVQPLAPPVAEAIPASPLALPLVPATSTKPPSPLIARLSTPASAEPSQPLHSVKPSSSAKSDSKERKSDSKERRRRDDEKRSSETPEKARAVPAAAKAVVATAAPSVSPPVPTFVAASAQPLVPGEAVPRAAAWKVRRQLYSTSAAVMAVQMHKLLAEQQREVAKLAEWKRQRIDLTDAATASTPSPSASNPNPTLEGEDRISLHLAYKVLSRVLLLDYLRASAQRWSDGEWKERLMGCPSSSMPGWWQPELHDWSTWKGVLEHGLGMIDDVLADPALTPAWTSAVQGEKREKRDGKAFLTSFLRDKGPLLRRLHSACNWAVHRGPGPAKDGAEDDWLEWLLTSKRELKSAAFRVSHNVGAYNATSSHTLKALSEATRGQDDDKDDNAADSPLDGTKRSTALLSIQSISNWARIKESALRLQPATATATSSSSAAATSSRSKKEDPPSGDEDNRRRSSVKTSPKDKSRRDSHSPSSQSLDEEERRKRRRHRRHRPSSASRSSRGSDSTLRSKRPSSRSRRPSSTSSSRVPHVRPKMLPKVPPRDAQNRPILPLPIRGGITITNLGRIVSDRPLYHTSNTIYPVNFTSQRSYYSLKNPNTKVVYTSQISDGGVSPLFIVTPADDRDSPIINRTASGAWGEVIRKVHRLKGKGHLKVTQSGPMIFGVANSLIKQLVGELDGADVIRRRWEKAREDGRALEEDDEMKDDDDERQRGGEQRRKDRGDGQPAVAGAGRGRDDDEEADEYSDSDSRSGSGSGSGSDSRSSDSDGSASDSDDGESGSGSGSDSSDSRQSNSSDEEEDEGDGRGRRGRESSHSAGERSARPQKAESGGHRRRR